MNSYHLPVFRHLDPNESKHCHIELQQELLLQFLDQCIFTTRYPGTTFKLTWNLLQKDEEKEQTIPSSCWVARFKLQINNESDLLFEFFDSDSWDVYKFIFGKGHYDSEKRQFFLDSDVVKDFSILEKQDCYGQKKRRNIHAKQNALLTKDEFRHLMLQKGPPVSEIVITPNFCNDYETRIAIREEPEWIDNCNYFIHEWIHLLDDNGYCPPIFHHVGDLMFYNWLGHMSQADLNRLSECMKNFSK